ncbi:carboxypeptidase-like regulatory domain-containing protein [Chryseobacterium gotjawalense]|uniref:Carboxypeptidase-like regulatory domain-containing protein n=1 Tax=Chryseobacterium gotjawalense TaxID=3042315 RepID=A0ABY8RBD9_9FLAO|nr:carboxypeptidase-like regulatory domain-containing protein [Chryseobacterium sp. wdc7]WHF50478.1 carboxypeptidase-like regulatory domain-containing protein [Chryseobacterium sp. wdc7]
MRRIFGIFCLIFSFSSLVAQQVSGTVTDEEKNPLPAVLVFNMKTEKKGYTDLNGQFTIDAAANDELRFIRQGFQRGSRIVNSPDFYAPFTIAIIRSIQEIEEVKIPPVRLTGDLNRDAGNLSKFDKVAQLQREIGVPGPPEKPRETPPPTLEKVGILAFAASNLNLNTLYKNISGDGRRMRQLYKYEDLQDNISWIRGKVGDEYFIKMEIPGEKIAEFLQFSIGIKPEINKYIKAGNLSKVLFIIEETLPQYLNR